MKYTITARDEWGTALTKRFGNLDSTHELTDTEVVQAIIEHGRAEITKISDDECQIEFQNGYD